MRPPSRKTQTTNNPGAVDLPKSHKPPSEVTAEKERKKEAAVANTKKKHQQAEQVARVEREIKVAQGLEGGQSSRKASQVKKNFPRPSASFEDQAKIVSHIPDYSPSCDSPLLGHTRGDSAGRSTDSPPSSKTKSFYNG